MAVGQHSGLAGIAHWINSYFGLEGENVGQKAAIVISLKEMVDKEYAMGRTTIMSDGELEAMIKQLAPEFPEKR